MRKKSKLQKFKIPTSDEPIDLDEQDYSLIQEYGKYANFLGNLNPEAFNKHSINPAPSRVKRNESSDEWESEQELSAKPIDDYSEDSEADFEMEPRMNKNWQVKELNRLPIIHETGKIQQLQPRKDSDSEDSSISSSSESGSEQEPEPEPQVVETPISNSQSHIPEEMANLATLIMENPEENMQKLKILHKYAQSTNPSIVKLSILTQLVVFKDIIPGYRIRALTEKEKKVQVSKDVKKVREFEQNLLANYQNYLKSLEPLLKNAELRVHAAKCFAELLVEANHFNFRSNIMSIVVLQMASTEKTISSESIKAIREIFKSDERGDASLEACQLISKLLKDRKYKVKPPVIDAFQDLRLGEIRRETVSIVEKKRKKDREHRSKKMRKIIKKDNEVEKELKEAEAVYDKKEREKFRSETLKHLFVVYFRILKESRDQQLISSVLKGLAKFANLINVDLFEDLLKILRDLSESMVANNESSTASAIHCVVAAFQLCSTQVLNVDLKDFSYLLYQFMLNLIQSKHFENREGSILYLLKALDLSLVNQKQTSIERVAAFAKRLGSLLLYLPTNSSMAGLAILKQLFIKYPRLEALLESERVEMGVWKPFSEDPDLANPFNTNSWELALLKNHYNPSVSQFCSNIAAKSTSLSCFNKPYSELFEKYSDFKIRLEKAKNLKTKDLDGFSAYLPSQFE